MTIPHNPIFYILFIVFAIAIGFNNYLASDNNPQVTANESNIEILFDQSKRSLEADITHEAAMMSQSIAIANIRNQSDANYEVLKTEILKNRNDIIAVHTTITPKPGSETAKSDTPIFTFTITKTQWLAGETITFTGTGQPGKPVQAFARIGGESLKGSTVVLETGSYVLDMKTEFSSTKGTWQVFANHLKVKSDILEFQLQ